MTTTSATEVAGIPGIDHQEAMELAEVEARRFLDVVAGLSEADWSLPTDCVGWDVKALLSHELGAMEANARMREFVRQYMAASRAAKRSGRPMIDEMTASHVLRHGSLSPAEMTERIRNVAPQAVRGRRRTPALMRSMPIKPGPPFDGTWKLGYLIDTVMNRDYWMHRVDLTRATGVELVVTANHDGRIVADVVAEWARSHGTPFALVLEGTAGGAFSQGEGAEELRLDAIEFCRILSGRSQGAGLLNQQIPF